MLTLQQNLSVTELFLASDFWEIITVLEFESSRYCPLLFKWNLHTI